MMRSILMMKMRKVQKLNMHNERDLDLVSKLSAPYITLCDFYISGFQSFHQTVQRTHSVTTTA